MKDDIGKASWPGPGFLPGLGELGRRQFEAAARMQQALIETAEDLNRAWHARIQSQVSFASDLAGRLTTARTAPDIAAAYEHSLQRQVEIIADDIRLLADTEKFWRAAARGWPESPIGLSS